MTAEYFAQAEREAKARLGLEKAQVKAYRKHLASTWAKRYKDENIALTSKASFKAFLRSAAKTFKGKDAEKRELCDVAATLAAVANRPDLRKIAVGLREYYSMS